MRELLKVHQISEALKKTQVTGNNSHTFQAALSANLVQFQLLPLNTLLSDDSSSQELSKRINVQAGKSEQKSESSIARINQ